MDCPTKEQFDNWLDDVLNKEDAERMTSQLKSTPFDVNDRDVKTMSDDDIDEWVAEKIIQYRYGSMYRMRLPSEINAFMGHKFITYIFTEEIKRQRDNI